MSIAAEFIRANPLEDFFEGYSVEFALADAERFVEWTEKQNVGWDGSPANVKTLQDWLTVNECPITFRNLQIGFYWLRAEGLLEKEKQTEPSESNAKYSRPVVQRVVKTDEQKAEEAAEIAGIGTIGPGVRRGGKLDVDPNLRAAYQKSLVAKRNGGKKPHMSEGQARAQIAAQFPELKPDSAAYNEWVARLRFDQYE